MSHYTVAVITNKKPSSNMIEELLSPYDESLSVPIYISKTKKELILEERRHLEEYKDTPLYQSYLADPEGYIEKHKNQPQHIEYVTKTYLKKCAMSDEELYDEITKDYDSEYIDKDGNILSTYNPKSKWDWYTIGGRWNGCIPLKEPCNSNTIKLTNIAWGNDVNIDDYLKAHPELKTQYEKLIKDGDFYTAEYYQKRYPTIDDFVNNKKNFTTYAVLTPDGEWHEPGRMGWFSISDASTEDEINWSNNYYKDFVEPYLENGYLTLVDCHI